MGKAILILVIMFVGAIGYIVYEGTKKAGVKLDEKGKLEAGAGDEEGGVLADSLQESASELGDKVVSKAKDAGERIKKGAGELATKTKKLVFGEFKLKIEPFPVEMKAGETLTLKVTRESRTLGPLTLVLKPGPGAKLTAKGGVFKDGQKTSEVVLKAEPGPARKVQLNIQSGELCKPIPVDIK